MKGENQSTTHSDSPSISHSVFSKSVILFSVSKAVGQSVSLYSVSHSVSNSVFSQSLWSVSQSCESIN